MELLSEDKNVKYDTFADLYYLIFVHRDRRAAQQILNMQGFTSGEIETIEDISFSNSPLIGKQVVKVFYFLGKKSGGDYLDPQGRKIDLPKSFYYDSNGNRVDEKREADVQGKISGQFLPVNYICSSEAELRKQFTNWLIDSLKTVGSSNKVQKRAGKVFDEAEKLAPKSFS